jgi:hypothetical protein
MDQTVFDYEQYIKQLTQEGYLVDDPRFEYVKGLSRLLMYLHDSMKSLILIDNASVYEPEDVSNEHLLQQALLRNAILNYSKCFTETGKGHIKLEKSKVYDKAPHFIAVHEKMLQLRHQFFAHSDNSGLDMVIYATKETEDKIIAKQLYTIILPANEFDAYLMLFKYCGDHVKAKIEKSFTNLRHRYGKEIIGFGVS